MKISFPVIRGGSGTDIFIDNLTSGLIQGGVEIEIQVIHSAMGIIPSLAGAGFRVHDADLVHSNTWSGFGFKKGIPLVVTGHSAVRTPELKKYHSTIQQIYYQLIKVCEQKSLRSAESVCTVSRFASDYLERMYGYSDANVIYNGIDPARFSPHPSPGTEGRSGNSRKPISLFFAGNRRVMKGFDLLPEIMADLGDEFHLSIAAGLRGKNSAPTGKYIHDLGRISPSEMPALYNSCDIYLFPSRLEGFGLSVAEAMACGKPVVTTDCSSLPELVIDGKGGYLCPMDDVSAFAEAIRHLAEDEDLRARMGRFNRQRVMDHFTIEKMTREYLRVYRKTT